MESPLKRSVKLTIDGMTCANCQTKIEQRLSNVNGVSRAKVNWKNGKAEVEFDENVVSLEKIMEEIGSLGYSAAEYEGKKNLSTIFSYAAAIALLFAAVQKSGILNALVPSSLASSQMGYALLFVTGLFTSVHCVAMCGGINLSQSIGIGKGTGGSRKKAFSKPLLYSVGRIVSYTLTGLALGSVGAFFGGNGASIPFFVQGALKAVAGFVMILMGISLLGVFPFVRSITPHLPLSLSRKIAQLMGGNRTPFMVGFLNGFMPCGPLQAMWLVSFVSGNPLSGAFSMLAFVLGTIPLTLGFGAIVSFLGKKWSAAVTKAGAVIVVVMGLSMVSQGFALGGWTDSGKKTPKTKVADATPEEQKVKTAKNEEKTVVKSVLNPYRYPTITVKKGVPVHWEIEATKDTLNGCNYKMLFPEFGFMYEMGYGTNVIEFTPEKTGTFMYTCWMGMVRGVVNVVE